MPTADEFRTELYRMMHEALERDCEYVEIEAGELHRRVGGYPVGENRMPNCCQVMTAEVATDVGDVILHQPPSGQGASLRIRYTLPRPANAPTHDHA